MKRMIASKVHWLKRAVSTNSVGERVRLKIIETAPLHHIKDPVVRTRSVQDHVYRALEKKYGKIVAAAREPTTETRGGASSGIPKIVWWCWFQGFEAAPEIVRACFESVRRNMPGYEIRLITEANYRDYVELPDYILDRRSKRLINSANFSDLIRMELLVRYGGVWVDATVFMSSDGLCGILDRTKDLFMPSFVEDFYGFTAESWLIAARPDNDILRLTRDLLWAYWKDYKMSIEYMLVFLFFTMAAKRYPEQWHEVYPYCREPSLLLFHELDNPFSERRYEEITEMAPFHKLNWKWKYKGEPGSFYDVLIRQGMRQ